ncbi:MAG: hypothetical protein ACREQN_01130 [Candidatus Binataceae bacterium]
MVVLVAMALLCVHGGLLAASIPNYRVTIDSAYHVSLARDYGEHGQAWWDHINFGPRGRPNLQAPLMHAVVGAVGRALGGSGDDYVLANAIVAVAQWAAAMGTAGFFAYELGGAWALLLAAALLSGAAFAGGSFAVGIPSGWMFILTAWAIWFFLRDRAWVAAIFTSAAIYAHLGGYATAPLGIIIAAALSGRWRALMVTGVITAIVTAPYTIHVIRYLGWLSGVHSHSALLFDPMLDLIGFAGAARLFRHPRRNAFMVAWLCAPAAWIFQDPGRFILQSGMAASVAAALLLVDLIGRAANRRRMITYAAAIAAVATIFPLGAPSLASEISWDAGFRYPRVIEWHRARTLAGDIEQAGLGNMLVAEYNPALCPALAVYAPLTCEKGHWIEVEPRHDPADLLGAAAKVYVLPLATGDTALAAAQARGWIVIHGGAAGAAVVTLARKPSVATAAAYADGAIANEGRWLAANAINNSLALANWHRMVSATAFDEFQHRLALQRAHAGRLELACIIYAYALEGDAEGGVNGGDAHEMRRVARGMGVTASFLGDGLALDFIGGARFAELRRNFARVATVAAQQMEHAPPDRHGLTTARLLENSLDRLLAIVLTMRGDTFAARPAGDSVPWLSHR